MNFESLGINKGTAEIKKDFSQDIVGRLAEKHGYILEHSADFIQNYLDELRGHDRKTYEHSIAVGDITAFIVKSMEGVLSEGDREILLGAAYLHDCGKVGIESEILNKEAKLSDEEMEKIKMHPEIGYDILKEYDIYIAYVVKFHHKHQKNAYPKTSNADEMIDGSVDKERIHRLSRILAMVDSFQAMLANRPGEHNRSKAIDATISELRRNFSLSSSQKVSDQEVIFLLEKYYRQKYQNEAVDYNQYIGLSGNA